MDDSDDWDDDEHEFTPEEREWGVGWDGFRDGEDFESWHFNQGGFEDQQRELPGHGWVRAKIEMGDDPLHLKYQWDPKRKAFEAQQQRCLRQHEISATSYGALIQSTAILIVAAFAPIYDAAATQQQMWVKGLPRAANLSTSINWAFPPECLELAVLLALTPASVPPTPPPSSPLPPLTAAPLAATASRAQVRMPRDSNHA